MKKLSLMMIAMAILVCQACRSGSGNTASATDTSAAGKDTTNKMAAAKMIVDKGDSAFVVTAANDGMTEVALGKVAKQKALNARLKNFAGMMVTDHTRVGNQLADVAKSKSISIPAAPNAASQKVIDDLSAKSGKDFDKSYVKTMVDGHEKAVNLFEGASKTLKDSSLKAFVMNTLPTLKMHLDSIKAIRASMK